MNGIKTFTQFGVQVTAALGDSLEQIAVFNVRNLESLGVEVQNTHGLEAFTGFSILVRAHKDGNYVTMLISTATSGGMQKDASLNDMNTLAADSSEFVLLEVSALESIQLKAKTSSSGSCSVFGSGS